MLPPKLLPPTFSLNWLIKMTTALLLLVIAVSLVLLDYKTKPVLMQGKCCHRGEKLRQDVEKSRKLTKS
jgi:hypothetical protein